MRWLIALALIALPAGCQGDQFERCSGLRTSENYEDAVVTCERMYRETGDGRFGLEAARAALQLGRYDDVLEWSERLEGTEQEAFASGLAGWVFSEEEMPDQARKAYAKALELHLAAGDSKSAASAAFGLFHLAWTESDYATALPSAAQAFEHAQRAGDDRMRREAGQALFALLLQVGDLAVAEAVLRLSAAGGPEGADRAYLLNNQGALQLRQGRPGMAAHSIGQALEAASDLDDKRFFRSAHLNLVESNLALGNWVEAERHLQTAKTYADSGVARSSLAFYQAQVELERGDLQRAAATLDSALQPEVIADWAWQLRDLRGRVAEAAGDPVTAERNFRASIEVLEGIRDELGFIDFRASLLEEKRKPFEALFRLQASKNVREALRTLERVKARAFLDAFVQASSEDPASSGSQPDFSAAAERLEGLSALLPAVGRSQVVRDRPLEATLEWVADRFYLDYLVTGDEIWLVYPRHGQIQAVKLPGSTALTRSLLERFESDPGDPETAGRLGDMLIPKDALPPPGALLHIVPDGALGRVPFAALRRSGRYLVEDYSIVYVPSLAALASIETNTSPQPEAPVVIGDPTGDLPAARLEADIVARRLGVRPITGPAAVSERLIAASAARWLHLSAHTGLDAAGPWLALADRRVRAAEIVSGRLAPKVVVLATCASAARRGKGLLGSVGAAFLAAGSRSVLASLWSVRDNEADDFVAEFYREGEMDHPATSLRRAQRALLEAGRPVAAWAPYVLFGSGRAPGRPEQTLSKRGTP